MKAERIETVYNYDEWCRLVERHGKKILKRYICRKIRKVARFMSVVLVMYEVISDGCCLGEGNLCIDSMKIQTD